MLAIAVISLGFLCSVIALGIIALLVARDVIHHVQWMRRRRTPGGTIDFTKRAGHSR